MGHISVPHDPVNVPISGKHVNWKLTEDEVSTVYISEKWHITLIHPSLRINLLSYKENLDQYFTEWTKIDIREVIVYGKSLVSEKILSLYYIIILLYYYIIYHENSDVLYQYLSLLIW